MIRLAKKITQFKILSVVFLSAVALSSLVACNRSDSQTPNADLTVSLNDKSSESRVKLRSGFLAPPQSSKPLTWFHAMSGNMSAEGITKDLEAIAEVGLGGTLLFNVTQGIPLGKVKFNSEQHIDLIGHIAKESQRLDLTFGMHNCDGWTSSGGPWVTPEHSMKRLTFNEVVVSGGAVDVALTQPPSLLNYYQDVAIIAYPALQTEIDDAIRKPIITASDVAFDSSVVVNNDLTDYSTVGVNSEADEAYAWVQFSYESPYTLRLIDMLLHNGRGLNVSLHTSDDGKTFKKVDDLKLRRPGKTVFAYDEAFAGYTAKYFRLVSDKPMSIKELRLSSTPTMDNYSGRTSASRSDFQEFDDIGNAPASLTIQSSSIRNLTADLNSEGRLITTLPEGRWTIMRFGYTTTGAVNIPASREGTGLEVDKFSKAAFKLHYDNYMANVINKVKQVAPNAMHTLEIDSFEVGAQNWTHDYEQAFEAQYGYDLIPYLPLFAGKFLDSAKTSEAVLWDTRDLNNRLITENYYGYFTELANKDGIQTYLEPYGSGPFNELDAARKADLPMGEFWLDNNNFRLAAASSAAHLYNKPIVAAEAFTQFPGNNWLFHPAKGKVDGNKSWALGVNQHVFHRFAHQANTHVMPGMTMNRWGAHMDRTQPWWFGAGKAWFEYIARGQYLLREGNAVADILWYLGDATPTTCPEKDALSAIVPVNINYDCLNSDVLHQLDVQDGMLTLPHGSQYKVLVLNNHKKLTLKSVKAIYALAKKGAVIVGKPVDQLVGRFNTEAQQAEFKEMVGYIWSQANTYSIAFNVKTNHGHTGEVPDLAVPDTTLIDWQAIYAKHDFRQDLQVKGVDTFYFTHRQSPNSDMYFLYNDSQKDRLFDATFNVSGKIPELWDAKTGVIKRLGAFEENKNTTRVAFRLAPAQSVFVVFSESSLGVRPLSPDVVVNQDVQVLLNEANQHQIVSSYGIEKIDLGLNSGLLSPPKLAQPLVLNGSWHVQFKEHYGLNQRYTFDKLIDWRKHNDEKVQNYSGTATYNKQFNVDALYLKENTRLQLDLGQVSVAATVFINDKFVGTGWVAPYQLDISGFVQEGNNEIRIEVANLWVNRLLADRKLPDTSGFRIARWQDPIVEMPQWYTDNKPPPPSQRVTFSTQIFMADDEPTQASGLMGPVQINVSQITPLSN